MTEISVQVGQARYAKQVDLSDSEASHLFSRLVALASARPVPEARERQLRELAAEQVEESRAARAVL